MYTIIGEDRECYFIDLHTITVDVVSLDQFATPTRTVRLFWFSALSELPKLIAFTSLRFQLRSGALQRRPSESLPCSGD